MKKSLLSITFILLLILLPYTVFAGTGENNVKVKDANGNQRTDSIEKAENASSKNKEVDTPSTEPESTNVAGETILYNVGRNISYSIADEFLLSGVKINSLKVEEEKVSDDGSLKYSIFSKELDLFNVPFVNNILLITGGIYVIGIIIIGGLAYIAFSIQSSAPKWFSEIRMELTGEEKYFNINDVFSVWGSELLGPMASYGWVYFWVEARNLLVSGMVTDIVTNIASTSDSWPSYFIACVTWYFDGLQRLTAEFGLYFFISMIFVQWILANMTAIIASVPKAAGFIIFNHIYFVLLLAVDVETIFFMWFGVGLGAKFGMPEFSIVGIIVAFFVGLGIILSLPLYIASRIYFRRGSVTLVGL